jgi:hypothetical protein
MARRPDGFLARRAGLGQKFAARQSGRAGPGPQNTESGFSLARPDPARPELMPRFNRAFIEGGGSKLDFRNENP